MVAKRRRSRIATGVHEAESPAVLRQDPTCGEGTGTDRIAPIVAFGTGQLDRREHHVDHAVEDRVFVRHVVVERHRLHAQFLRHPAHGDRLHAAAIRDPDRGFQHEASAQRLWWWWWHDGSGVWAS